MNFSIVDFKIALIKYVEYKTVAIINVEFSKGSTCFIINIDNHGMRFTVQGQQVIIHYHEPKIVEHLNKELNISATFVKENVREYFKL